MPDIADLFVRVPGKKWCLVQAKPRNEKYTAQNCAGWGILVYLPLITKVAIHNRSKRITQLPMFPGYLFACADLEETTLIRRDKGVWNVQPLSVPEEESLLRDLKAVRECEKLSENHELVVNPGLQPGDIVRFRTGPFRDLDVIVVRRESVTDVVVNVEFLGRNITVKCEADELVP